MRSGITSPFNPVLKPRFRLIDLVTSKFPILASFLAMGRSRAELQLGLRSFSVENYLIFYRQTGAGVEILHVAHGARDLEKLFE